MKPCKNNELSTVLVAEALLSFPRKNVNCNLCDVTKCDGSEFMILPDGQRQDLFFLSLR
jgi:hypothetical protein